jgi:opacity protein-like surface antigen
MNGSLSTLVALAALAALPLTGAAQTSPTSDVPFSIEIRASLAHATGDIAEDDDVGTGIGIEATGEYAIAPLVSIYGGWSRVSFGVDSGDDSNIDLVDSGFQLGGKVYIPVATGTPVAPWIRVGGIFNQARIHAEDTDASIEFKSDRSIGFEVGAGLDAAVAPNLSLAPELRYRRYGTEFDAFSDLGGAEGDVTYFTLGLGLRYHF